MRLSVQVGVAHTPSITVPLTNATTFVQRFDHLANPEWRAPEWLPRVANPSLE